MKLKFIILLLLIVMPYKVFAYGGFDVSNTSLNLYIGETKTIKITSDNAVGKLNISSSNSGVASTNVDSVFIQTPGASENITITANSVGTTTISIVASENFATMDEEILSGKTKSININIIEKPEVKPVQPEKPEVKPEEPEKPSKPSENQLSKNNNIRDLKVEGYKLKKVDNNNYTLSVASDVTSIKISATAEDKKAKITGIGEHDLKAGENNFVVIVTPESGEQNKINIIITRKDGFSLEDLDSALKSTHQDIDIIILEDTVVTKEHLTKIKNSKKTIRLNYYDENKKLLYSWIIDGKQVKNEQDFLTTVSGQAENKNEISKLSNYADGLYINIKHAGNLPTGIKLKIYTGEKFNDGNEINMLYYDTDNNTLNFIEKTKVNKDYIEINVKKSYQYFLTMSNINSYQEQSSSVNIYKILFTTLELIIIIVLVVFIVMKIKSNKKNINQN